MGRMLLLALTIAAGVGAFGYYRGRAESAPSEWAPKLVIRNLLRAENLLVSTRVFDRNKDGNAEYAFLTELTAASELPAARSLPKALAPVGNGIWGLEDYYYQVWISDVFGTARHEDDPGFDPDEANGDQRRFGTAIVIYAWPKQAKPGAPAYFAAEDGTVLETAGAHPYFGLPGPEPDAALIPDEATARERGELRVKPARNALGADGITWIVTAF